MVLLFSTLRKWFGPRILKTGLGVTIALLICQLFSVEPANFAAITVAINMQPSVSKALTNAWEQVLINIIAIALAIVLGLTLGTNPYIIGLAVILMIAISNRMGWSGVNPGIVSIIFILDAPYEQFLEHALSRSLSIFIGLAVALIINRVLAPPRHKRNFKENLFSLFYDSSIYFLNSLVHYVESTTLSNYEKPKPTLLEERLEQVTNLYEHAREEFNTQDKMQLMERLLELCRGFIERGENIEEMTRQRVKRRQAPDAPPQMGTHITQEFQSLLDYILVGRDNLAALRDQLYLSFTYPPATPLRTLDQAYWNEFDQIMDLWQKNFSGVYFLRATMEIGVVATEMRWASKRMRSCYELSQKKKDKNSIYPIPSDLAKDPE
ncbi:MAG: aromatic acid exporter family protein [Desulfitobacterium sp.]